ncbi:hypothetical protein NQ315_003102 [Exocentrus adspersus]|uniref:PEHE domain-containing protein n=1 Tax=Exocentrus adspersus TaxID=1586481 RepID=A0AAV8W4Z3_9CUCU|nr:hypothetical protein NQ315_003102 [Exocentrus adspersus]
MGLRTASVRRPRATVMAPALTETAQTRKFNLPSKACLEPASPINNEYPPTYLKDDEKLSLFNVDGDGLSNAIGNLNNLVSTSEKFVLGKHLIESSGASDNIISNSDTIMSVSPSPMGDQDEKMGLQLQKTGLDVSGIHKTPTEMDQLLNNLESVLPETDAAGDLSQNVEDIMQVIKSIESSGQDRLNNIPNELNSESEEVFPITGTDLTNNLSSLEKELLEGVDMMNMTMEDQQDELETVGRQKEIQAQEVLAELQKKHAKIERRLDFLRRRVYKLQSRHMGQHVSGEIAGVYENVHRSLKRTKDSYDMPKQESNYGPVEKHKPMSYGSAKALVRKLEVTTNLQANTASRQRHASKYFGSGSIEVPTFRSNVAGMLTIPSWPSEAKSELQKVAGQLQTQLKLVQEEVDSEATESSSGGESCDEMQIYNNPHQQYLGIQKRAVWKYSTERAAIAARWTWLQAQIADLEYRIRQHTDLHKQIRTNKGAVQLGGTGPPSAVPSSPTTVNGYRGQLPGSSPLTAKVMDNQTAIGGNGSSSEFQYQCSRTRPLVNFRKRKLLQVSGLHAVSKKAARPSTIRCGCVPMSVPCALCTGRTDPTHPRDQPETLSKAEKVALLDPCFHPVFSLPEDVSQHIHLEAIMKTSEWQQKSTRMKTLKILSKPDRLEPKSLDHRVKKLEHRKKYGRLLKPSTMSALSAKIKNKIRGRKPGRHSSLNRLHRKRHPAKDGVGGHLNSSLVDGIDEELESIGNNSNTGTRSLDSPSSSPLLQIQSISGYNRTRNRIQSYDIDNIVIPYSVAASTRVEKLQYKEILTPKWRIAELDLDKPNSKDSNGKDSSQDSDVEDLTDDSVIARHERSEYEEKKRFLSYLKLPIGYGRSRSHKRTDSRAESSGANTPDPMSPHTVEQDIANSPVVSPPATPLSVLQPDEPIPSLPSVAAMRRRTISQSRFAKDKEPKEETTVNVPEEPEVAPYEKRTFPITDEVYEKMLKHMPENHQFIKTNVRAQDSSDCEGGALGYLDRKVDSPDSESTESAIGDGDEDPNDPEWIDMERANRERYKR